MQSSSWTKFLGTFGQTPCNVELVVESWEMVAPPSPPLFAAECFFKSSWIAFGDFHFAWFCRHKWVYPFQNGCCNYPVVFVKQSLLFQSHSLFFFAPYSEVCTAGYFAIFMALWKVEPPISSVLSGSPLLRIPSANHSLRCPSFLLANSACSYKALTNDCTSSQGFRTLR